MTPFILTFIVLMVIVAALLLLSFFDVVHFNIQWPWYEMQRFSRMDSQKQRECLIKKYLGDRVPVGWTVAFKGFHDGMECMNNFKYKEGKTYTCSYEPILCTRGFHACLAPRDVFAYYYKPGDVYHIVFLKDVTQKEIGSDTKVCAKKIKIGPRIDSRYITENNI